MVVQAAGLLIGSVFVLLVATADTTVTLLVAMTGFGVCKGFYDSGIFAVDVRRGRAAYARGRGRADEHCRLGWRGARPDLRRRRHAIRSQIHGSSKHERRHRRVAPSSISWVRRASFAILRHTSDAS